MFILKHAYDINFSVPPKPKKLAKNDAIAASRINFFLRKKHFLTTCKQTE